ncbi:MAG: 5'-nucleotidase C-terminal domain-containing protein [Coleofasciculaceae cyanobacterium]
MAEFTLQLLHAADQEASIPALDNAPRFSAVLNALRNEDSDADGNPDFPNTLVLSSGDAYIPGPFFSASNTVFGGQGRGDILIQNELGFQAIAFGNHEFDAGTGTVEALIESADGYPGTAFPYLSSNLDFSTEEDLADLVVPEAQAPQPNSISKSVVIEVNGERIGVVGAATPNLPEITSTGDIGVFPTEFAASNPADIAALAAEIQQSVDVLTGQGINKVILLAHMQQIAVEQALAEVLTDVDIIVAGGSNTLLADDTDRLRVEDSAQGPYPILKTDAEGNPVAVVNTEGGYEYVGRLVADFNEQGIIIPESINPNISGAYATDAEGVAAVNGTPDPEIVEITDALREIVAAQEGNIFGSTEVFLNGTRGDVRTQETNLGNLTADANLEYAQQFDSDVVISLKNGGGIRDNIGQVTVPPGATNPDDFLRLPPAANELAGKEEGDISQLDIQNTLRFNNALSLVTVTAEQLLQVIEYAVSASTDGATPGQFPQVGGLAFSFDDDLPAGDRVQSLAVQDAEGNTIDVVVEDGELVGDASRTFRMVTLNFLAGGGDGYPFPEFENLNRVDLEMEGVQTGDATFADDGTEQDALAEYLLDNFSETPFDLEDVPPGEDTRIQNLDFRQDTVLADTTDQILFGDNSDETLTGGLGDDQIFGSEGVNTLNGGAGNDTIYGGSQMDMIMGGLGNDTIFASEGNNQVNGGAGDDIIYSGSGNDLIDGGLGNDTIWLGGGMDTVVIAEGNGSDIINNFQIGQTMLGLSGGLTFEDLTIAQGDNAALVNSGDELLASLNFVSASSITSDAFVTV